jgi:hypothetical protein
LLLFVFDSFDLLFHFRELRFVASFLRVLFDCQLEVLDLDGHPLGVDGQRLRRFEEVGLKRKIYFSMCCRKYYFNERFTFLMWCIKHYLTSILHVKSENLTLLFNVLQESSKTYFPNYNLSLYFTFQYVAFKFLFCRLK